MKALNFDVFLNLATRLDVCDVITLGKASTTILILVDNLMNLGLQCNRLLREFALSHRTWIELGRGLILKGIPLPTKGFKSPDNLSPEELKQSVIKADRIYRSWTSSTARASRMTSVVEEGSGFKHVARDVTRIVPITSDIVTMLQGETQLII